MKNKLTGIILSVLIILAAGWCIRWYVHKTVTPKMQFEATEFILTGSNTKTTINELKGNVVIVSFFQTWCGPCAGEIPVLNELVTNLNSSKIKILYISDEDINLINAYQKQFNAAEMLFAHSPKSLATLGIYVYPTTYLLNKKGEVINSKLEGYDWRLAEETIKKLLAE
jgi:cytochrome c biogenesis protein CcmG, thiol:disulfide interchange protein DsbE